MWFTSSIGNSTHRNEPSCGISSTSHLQPDGFRQAVGKSALLSLHLLALDTVKSIIPTSYMRVGVLTSYQRDVLLA